LLRNVQQFGKRLRVTLSLMLVVVVHDRINDGNVLRYVGDLSRNLASSVSE